MDQRSHYAIKGLRKKILLSSVVYTLAALLMISVLSSYPPLSLLSNYAEQNLLHAAQMRSLAVEEYLARMVEITRQISSRTTIRRTLADYLAGELSLEQARNVTEPILYDARIISAEAVGITRIDRNGLLIAHTGQPLPPQVIPAPDEIPSHVGISNSVLIDGQLFLVICGPIRHSDDATFLGQDLVMFTTTKLQRILWDRAGLGESGESFLARRNQQGVVLFFPSHRGTDEIYDLWIPDSPLLAALERSATGESGVMHIASDTGKGKTSVSFAPIQGSDWTLLVTIEQQELMAPLRKQIFIVSGLALFLTGLGTLGMLALLRPMTGRVMVYTEELDSFNRDLTQEINERKRAEKNLLRSEHEWAETFDAITDAVAIRNIHGQVLKMNRATAQLLGELTPGQSVEDGCRLIFGLDQPPPLCPFCRMIEEKQPQCGERHHAETDRWLHIACFPLLTEREQIWGGVLIAHDITEQKKLDRIKDEMISSISHEMRTPLTAMLGFVEFMLENPLERAQQMDFLQTVYRETERLNDLVSNFLDLQRLQAQVESYHFQNLDPCALLNEAAHLFHVASKKHRVVLQCPHHLPQVKVDEKRFMQVLKNLLSNAIKYSPLGGDVVLGASADSEQVLMFVRDQGLGIPSNANERIFERFYRVDDSAKRIPGGIGLGLSLVREIVKAHGGRVWVESEVGVGSTFYISLPLEEPGIGEE